MSTLTRGISLGATETVTNTKLQNLVDLGSCTGIVDADVSNAAAIGYSKLNLSGGITNSDINASAAITYSKLNLGTSIVNADVSASAAIVASKLDLTSPGAIGTTAPAAGKFTTLEGTTTLKLGTTNQGDILYDNGTSLTRLVPGTSGQFLKTLGASANPLWADASSASNVVYSWSGCTDYVAGDAFVGSVSGTSLTPTTGNTYSFFINKNASIGDQTSRILRSKFKKTAGISNLTIYANIWINNSTASGEKVSAELKVNTLTINTSDVTSITPTWANSSTLDVSSLTNGNVYDLSISLYTNGPVTMYAYLGSVIVFGS
jgi:hypothetical protein